MLWPSTNALQLCLGQNAIPTVHCCNARQAHSRQCVKCSYTYGDLLITQVCSDPAPMHCRSVQGTLQSPLFSAALQNRLTPGSVSLQIHLSRVCSSYRCAVTQHQCIAALFMAKCNPHCSVLLCKSGSQQAVCHCSHSYGDLLFMQVCSEPAPMHCSSVQGNMQSPLFSAALQNSVTPCMSHCSHTYGDLLFMQVCSEPPPMHCSKVQGKMHSPLFSAAVQISLTACLFHCNHTYGDLLFIHVCSAATPMHCSTGQSKMHSHCQCCSAKQAHSRHCVNAVTPMEKGSSYRCAVLQHQCTAALVRTKCIPTVQCCSAKQAHSMLCVNAVTPMEICSSYRCAVLQHQCTAALVRAKCIPTVSPALQNRLTAGSVSSAVTPI